MSNLYRITTEFSPDDTKEITTTVKLVTGICLEQVCAAEIDMIACDARIELISIERVGAVVQSLEGDEFTPKYEVEK